MKSIDVYNWDYELIITIAETLDVSESDIIKAILDTAIENNIAPKELIEKVQAHLY